MTIELSLANILASIVTNLGNTELNYISDFKLPGILSFRMPAYSICVSIIHIHLSKTEQSKLLAELSALDIPVWQYEHSVLRNRQVEEFLPQVCPIFETRYSQARPPGVA